MKKLKITLLFLTAALLVCAFAACRRTQYALSFETNGGSEIATVMLPEGGTIYTPEEPVKDNFTFGGWYSDAALSDPFSFGGKMPAHDVTIYAAWNPERSVRILFNSMEGSEVAPLYGKIGSALEAPADPEREGYRFGGWYSDAALSTPFAFTIFPEENVTLYARWDAHPDYAYVTYYGNGERLSVVPVRKGEAIVDPSADLFDETIVTAGWYSDASLENAFSFGGSASHDLALYTTYYTAGLQFSGGTVTGYEGSSVSVIVPDRYEGASVTAIGENAFNGSAVVSIVLPSSVTSVGASAFYNCQYLDHVNLSSNVTEIGAYAFFNDMRLTSYGDLTSVTVIPEGLFLGCEKLGAVTLSPEAVSVGARAFADCARLVEVVLPDGVEAVNDGLFSGCTALARVTLPASMRSFGTDVFSGCASLAELTLSRSNETFRLSEGSLYRENDLLYYVGGEEEFRVPQAVERIAAGAFDSNATLRSVAVTAPDTVIECGAFRNMRALQSLSLYALRDGANRGGYLAYFFGAESKETAGRLSGYIPVTLTSLTLTEPLSAVEDYAFYGAVGLETVNAAIEATEIGAYAFAYTAISRFTVTSGLQDIGDFAFEGCTSLEAFEVAADSLTFGGYDGCLYDRTFHYLYLVPCAKTEIRFHDNVQYIESYAFTSSAVTEVVVPESVVSIGKQAFSGCGALDRLTVPFLGDGAENKYMGYIFGAELSLTTDSNGGLDLAAQNEGMIPAGLRSITVTSPVTAIPDYAFAYFINLKEVNFPAGNVVTSYGHYAFYRAEIEAWDFTGVRSIGDFAFMLTALTSVSLPATLESAGEYSFGMIRDLETISLAEGITSIGNYMFYAYSAYISEDEIARFSSVEGEVVIPASVTTIGDGAFIGLGAQYDTTTSGYTQTDGFSLRFAEGSSLTTIGTAAFAYCGATEIAVPASVTSIGTQAFASCEFLKSVTFGSATQESALTSVGQLAFGFDTALTSVTFYTSTVPSMSVATSLGITIHAFYGVETNRLKIYVPADLASTFRTASGWSEVASCIVALPSAAEGGTQS